jgi:glycosyltransferase involved in cell wall biosynthesis
MTILYHFRTRGAGAEAVHIAGIVNAFEKMGHHVILSSPTGVDPRQTAGASPFAKSRTRPLPRVLFELLELLYNLPAFAQNLRLARRHDCNLIYERHAFFLFSTALVAAIHRCPLVVEVNELVGDPRVRAQPLFSGLARWSDRFLFRRASLVVVVSPHLQRRVMGYGIPADRILILPNAVSDEELAPPSTPPAPLLKDLPPNTFTLGFTGWLVEWHRLDFLIQALAAP